MKLGDKKPGQRQSVVPVDGAISTFPCDTIVVATGASTDNYIFNALNIDKRGLDAIDNKILRTIITKFKGGPVGANTIATAVGEDQGTLEEVYEPFLIKEGFIIRTPRGREVTELAYMHLGLEKGNLDFENPSLF